MKIIINKCYGGFSFSPEALEEWAKTQGLQTYRYTYNYKYKLLERNPKGDVVSTKDFGDKCSFAKCSTKDTKSALLDCRAEDLRTDSDMIAIVERLGNAANGMCAELKIVEIPDDVQYEINDYDGMETIHEAHRSW